MLVDVLEASRIVYRPIAELNVDSLPKMLVQDFKPNAVYVNARIAEGSGLGNGSYLIGCFVGDDVQIRDDAKIFGCRTGSRVSIGERSFIQETGFGENVRLGHAVFVGHRCGFGNGTRIDSASHFGAENSFGDDVYIGHWNFFGDNCRFGKNAQFGVGNIFYGHPRFAGMPEFSDLKDPAHRSDRLFVIMEDSTCNRRGYRSREVVTLTHYLTSSRFKFLRGF